jgi:hypothetical protein
MVADAGASAVAYESHGSGTCQLATSRIYERPLQQASTLLALVLLLLAALLLHNFRTPSLLLVLRTRQVAGRVNKDAPAHFLCALEQCRTTPQHGCDTAEQQLLLCRNSRY